MRLTLADLDAKLVTVTEDGAMAVAQTLPESHGIRFLCPACFQENGGAAGTHSIFLLFKGYLPLAWLPDLKRWEVSGTGLQDLTLRPSVHVVAPCGWHGWVTDGTAA